MKIQCSVCEAAEAKVLCCDDEAALCWGCDQKVHADNLLASKHQRVLLSSSSSQMPKCDICQEIVGYFFCLQDRALLCRKCDAAIHGTNTLLSLHQRFLLTGVKVGLEPTESWPSSSTSKTRSDEKILGPESLSVPQLITPVSSSIVGSDFTLSNLSFASGSAAGNVTQWPLDEFLRISGFNQNANFVNNGLSKANSVKFGGSICSRAVEGSQEANECLDQMPDTFWAVPQITSQHTESELHLSECYPNPSNCATFVPDVSSPWFQISCLHQEPCGMSSKKRRQF
ncbi:B-box zinc finger protein 22-like isoform X1 [Primulina eburnea]|uniref:B-box zinc finger protein 22-like isoform X1 n=1 Tax=Primulina eburnea TaxID=1245227 RepID=UPI003C6CBB10